jgi:hypothetical protein
MSPGFVPGVAPGSFCPSSFVPRDRRGSSSTRPAVFANYRRRCEAFPQRRVKLTFDSGSKATSVSCAAPAMAASTEAATGAGDVLADMARSETQRHWASWCSVQDREDTTLGEQVVWPVLASGNLIPPRDPVDRGTAGASIASNVAIV